MRERKNTCKVHILKPEIHNKCRGYSLRNGLLGKRKQGKPAFYVGIIMSCNLHANIFKLKK